ncbi:MAG: phosphatidylglycerol lysyltransferase domain-containing protein [Thermodesulfobacteriota bacterium]
MEELWKVVPEFAQFKDLSLEEKPLFDTLFDLFPPVISEFTFTNLFIWRHAYQLKISRLKNFLCLLSDQGENSFFFPPIGEGDMVECYRVLLQYLKEKGTLPKIARVPEAVVAKTDWKAEGFVAELDRAQSDYIYLTEDLIKLEGRKYHRKRNHIKQFKEKYSYRYIPLTSEWISECLRLETEWCDLRHCEVIPGLLNESIAIKEAFTHFEELGLKGGAILINGKVEAFTLGEPLNRDTVVIHIEKANSAYEGLYSLINQAFLENQWSGYTYVNREQDLGEEGLRKAKESYFPHHMVNKYIITLG